MVFMLDGKKLNSEQAQLFRAQPYDRTTVGAFHDAGEFTCTDGLWTSGPKLRTLDGMVARESVHLRHGQDPAVGDALAQYWCEAYDGERLVKRSVAISLKGREVSMRAEEGGING